MYFLYFLAINTLMLCLKMFYLQTMSGRQANKPSAVIMRGISRLGKYLPKNENFFIGRKHIAGHEFATKWSLNSPKKW